MPWAFLNYPGTPPTPLCTYPEQEGEFRVPVMDMPGLAIGYVHQRHDDIAKGRQGFVDAPCLLQSQPHSPSVPLSLGASKVHKVHQGCADLGNSIFSLLQYGKGVIFLTNVT